MFALGTRKTTESFDWIGRLWMNLRSSQAVWLASSYVAQRIY